ncbi:DivIVA domain-containing protein [Plantactinospora sp. B5E13]|uniref:DivIVA domain-containing protein n=1 Tax=unclassified Plantactinospora TaxID=2631981 RepID=UPI00325E84C0
MRVGLSGFRRSKRPAREQRDSGRYRSAAYLPLRPWQVRDRRFRIARVGQRGFDQAEVRAFLAQVADDLAAAYEAVARSREETARIKDALRRWQSEQAGTVGERGWP